MQRTWTAPCGSILGLRALQRERVSRSCAGASDCYCSLLAAQRPAGNVPGTERPVVCYRALLEATVCSRRRVWTAGHVEVGGADALDVAQETGQVLDPQGLAPVAEGLLGEG